MPKTTIKPGAVMKYVGDDHAFMKGLKVKVFKPILDDDEKPTGLWDVAPWIEQDQRFSWVTSDARREDLVPLDEEDKA
jgi:hypothetical protein